MLNSILLDSAGYLLILQTWQNAFSGEKSVDDKDTQAVAKYLFGNWEANWVGFNHARDFDLYPQPELAPLNNFGYPYAEVGGDPLNSFDPKEFKYDYVSKKL